MGRSLSSFHGTNEGLPIAGGDFLPSEELHREYADVGLFFLSANHVLFLKETHDLWYSAHERFKTLSASTKPGSEVGGTFFQDEPSSPLACKYQKQHCNPNLPEGNRCEPLRSMRDPIESTMDLLWPNSTRQRKLLLWSHYSMINRRSDLNYVVKGLGVSALKSRFSLMEALQAPLPDNQWQLDVENWHAINMAILQDIYVETARGPRDSHINHLLIRPSNSEEDHLCQNQVI